MLNIHAILSSIKFYSSADTFYRVHSPFVFDLLNDTLQDKRHFYAFESIEKVRNELLKNSTPLDIVDLGAGSKKTNKNVRLVKDITKTAVSPAYQSRFLFKLAQHMKAENIIELGTSLGITTLYLSGFSSKSTVHTLEGSPAVLNAAQAIFKTFERQNIKVYRGNFDQTLPKILSEIPSLDLCYIDGNHAEEPTLRYFEWCLPHVHKNTVLIFDDIYWSKEMTSAWQKIKVHPSVTLTIDLYYFGLVFFKQDFSEKQHFKILHAKFKPWQRYI